MTSIRFFIGRWRHKGQSLAQQLVKGLRHIRVEAKTRNDGALIVQLTLGVNAHAMGAQCDYMQRAEEASAANSVYDQFTAFGQINKYDFSRFLGHGQSFRDSPPYPLPAFQQGFRPIGKGAA